MYEEIINKCLMSNDMIEYLKTTDIYDDEILTIICSSPISVNRKIEYLNNLKEIANDTHNDSLLKYIDKIITDYHAAMKLLESNGIFSVSDNCYSMTIKDISESFDSLYTSYEEIKNHIELAMLGYHDTDYYWCNVVRWDKDNSGKLIKSAEYIFVNNKLYYLWLCDKYGSCDSMINPYNELHLSVPFTVGDILEIDGYPFSPKKHVLTISIGDNKDCCSFQALSYNHEKSIWVVGAVNHGEIGDQTYVDISPLFTIKKYNGELTDDDKFMIKLSNYMKKNPDLMEELWSYLYLNNMTTDEITKWIDNGCNINEN